MRAETLKKRIRLKIRLFCGWSADFVPEKNGKKIIEPLSAWYQIRTDSLRLALQHGYKTDALPIRANQAWLYGSAVFLFMCFPCRSWWFLVENRGSEPAVSRIWSRKRARSNWLSAGLRTFQAHGSRVLGASERWQSIRCPHSHRLFKKRLPCEFDRFAGTFKWNQHFSLAKRSNRRMSSQESSWESSRLAAIYFPNRSVFRWKAQCEIVWNGTQCLLSDSHGIIRLQALYSGEWYIAAHVCTVPM